MNHNIASPFRAPGHRPSAGFAVMERTLPKLSGHLVILALSVAVTLSVRTALKAQYSQERRQIEAQAREKRARQMASAWNALPLTGITTPDFAEAFLARLDLGTLHLTSAQVDRLQPRLREVLEYLRNPAVDTYLRLKTHGLHYAFKQSRVSEQAGRESAPATSALLDSEVKASVEDLWNNMRTNKSSPPLGRLTAICLDRVRIAVTHTNSPGSVFNGPVAQGFTIARSSINPGFTYRPLSQGTEELLRGGSFVLISFTARSDSSTNSGPVYLSLWWSESDKDWAPERLFTDGLLNTEVFF